MALLICRGCTAAFSVGAPRCPQCGSTDHVEQGEEQDMAPKITVHGGATDATTPDTEGSEQPSPGKSSSPSSETAKPSPKKSGAGRQKPARTTESPSPKDPTDSSSAEATDGDPTGPTSDADRTN